MQVSIEPTQGKKVEHNGVKIELLGQIGLFHLFAFSQYLKIAEVIACNMNHE